MRSLHLVTHPEATQVVERLAGGWYDSDLTARGAEQAERIAAVITARVPSNEGALFSSDLRRARFQDPPTGAARLGGVDA